MKEVEYQQTQDSILLVARLVQDLPLADFINAIGKAHAVAPILDPTLYRRALYELDSDGLTGVEKMDWLEKLARKLLAFQAEIKDMRVRLAEPV